MEWINNQQVANSTVNHSTLTLQQAYPLTNFHAVTRVLSIFITRQLTHAIDQPLLANSANILQAS